MKDATDLGDRFYLSQLDYGGWSGGIVSKDFLVDGLQMLVKKLNGPLCDRSGETKKKRKDVLEDDPAEEESTSEEAAPEQPEPKEPEQSENPAGE